MENNGVLLESGTNELEIVEFGIAKSKFGINVLKVREIINPVQIVALPQAHENIEGVIEVRGEVLPVVDMAKALGYPASAQPQLDKFIITEFNQQKMIFHVHGVDRIHRVSWNDIEKPTNLFQSQDSQIVGIVRKEKELILLLDFEKIVVDINPSSGITKERLKQLKKIDRSQFKIIVAEDSALLRKLLSDTLTEAGFQQIDFFENGRDALEFLKNSADLAVDLLITDIEMPLMDGLSLTKQVKSDPLLLKIPVVIFSSLITDDLLHKGKTVGADAQVSKPEIGELIKVIDQLLN